MTKIWRFTLTLLPAAAQITRPSPLSSSCASGSRWPVSTGHMEDLVWGAHHLLLTPGAADASHRMLLSSAGAGVWSRLGLRLEPSVWAIVQHQAAGGFHFSEGRRKCEKPEPENSFLPPFLFWFGLVWFRGGGVWFFYLCGAFHKAVDLNQAWNMNTTLIFPPCSVTLVSRGAG